MSRESNVLSVESFVTVDVNSSEKPVTYCRVGSLCPAIPCPVRQRTGTETRPYIGVVRS